MKVYYYCSYTKSPVGFRLGMIDTDDVHGETCELISAGIQPFIRECFSQGTIRRAHGLIPQRSEGTDQYFMLLKSKAPIKEDEIEYFINFAFVTDKREEYERWFQHNSQEETMLLQVVKDTIVSSGSPEFGFRVHADRLRALKVTYSLPEAVPASTDGVCVEAVLPRGDYAQLLDILGLTGCSIDDLNQRNWYLIKKKQQMRPWMIAAIAVATGAVILLILSGLVQQTADSNENVPDTLKEAGKMAYTNPSIDPSKDTLDVLEGASDIVLTDVVLTQEKTDI